jgi:hypothetical protein
MRSRGRVRLTYGSLQTVRTAKRRFRCDGHLTDPDDRHFIEPGKRYVKSSLPPNNSEIGNPEWWHLRLCQDCAPVEFAERVTS